MTRDTPAPQRLPRVITVDLDETLLDGSRLEQTVTSTCEMLASRVSELDADQVYLANTAAWDAYWPEIERDWELGHMQGSSVTFEAWRRTLRECGVHDRGLVVLAADFHRDLIRESYLLFDDAAPFCQHVGGVGIPLVLVTNGASDAQREKLEVLELEGWFDGVVISGEAGTAKPAPEIFSEALRGFGVDPGETWHVGDNPSKDVAGAKASGMNAIWLNRKGERWPGSGLPPDLVVSSLFELAALVERLEP